MGDKINKEFEEYQKYLEKRNQKTKFPAFIDISNDFYKLIDDISGSNLSKKK